MIMSVLIIVVCITEVVYMSPYFHNELEVGTSFVRRTKDLIHYNFELFDINYTVLTSEL